MGQLCLNITCDISISFLMIFPPSLIDDFLVKFCCFILFPAVYCTSELSWNMLAQCPYSWLNRHISSPSYWQWSNQLIFGCLTTCKYENVGYFHVVQMVCLNVYAHDMLCQIGRRQHDQPSWSSRKKPEFLHSENWEPTINGEYWLNSRRDEWGEKQHMIYDSIPI